MSIPELDAFLHELPKHLPALEVLLHGGRATGKDAGDIDVVVIAATGEADAETRAHAARKSAGLPPSTLDVVGIAQNELIAALQAGDTLLRTALRRGLRYPGGGPSSFATYESAWNRRAAVGRALRIAADQAKKHAACVRNGELAHAATAGERAWDYVVHAAALACGLDVEWKWNGNGAQSLSAIATTSSRSPALLTFLSQASVVKARLPALVLGADQLGCAIWELQALIPPLS